MFYFSYTSCKRLEEVHPDLVRVVSLALTLSTVDFTVLEGVRSKERQLKLFQAGGSRTLNSRHIPTLPADKKRKVPVAHAVDLGAWLDGEVRWDWPLYYQIANAMKLAALEEDVLIEWGGDWKDPKDGPHFQLPWKAYP